MTNRQRDHAGLYHAAELGDADAQYNLGTLYFVGQDVPQDYTEAAVRWLRRAAEQGNQFLNATDGRLLSGEKCTGAAVGPRLHEDRKGQFTVGYTKRLMELRESQLAEAATIAVEAGVLRRCELHPEITIQFADPSPAFPSVS